jgi:hypothetical protein
MTDLIQHVESATDDPSSFFLEQQFGPVMPIPDLKV